MRELGTLYPSKLTSAEQSPNPEPGPPIPLQEPVQPRFPLATARHERAHDGEEPRPNYKAKIAGALRQNPPGVAEGLLGLSVSTHRSWGLVRVLQNPQSPRARP